MPFDPTPQLSPLATRALAEFLPLPERATDARIGAIASEAIDWAADAMADEDNPQDGGARVLAWVKLMAVGRRWMVERERDAELALADAIEAGDLTPDGEFIEYERYP